MRYGAVSYTHLDVYKRQAWEIADAPGCIEMASVRPRAAIGRALRYAGLELDPGKIEWNSALEPRVIMGGSIAA